MNTDKRLQEVELKLQKIMDFLPKVELWVNVLAAQFQTNRNFIISLDKKPEEPKTEAPVAAETPETETGDNLEGVTASVAPEGPKTATLDS